MPPLILMISNRLYLWRNHEQNWISEYLGAGKSGELNRIKHITGFGVASKSILMMWPRLFLSGWIFSIVLML
jgi:hypothetical protein